MGNFVVVCVLESHYMCVCVCVHPWGAWMICARSDTWNAQNVSGGEGLCGHAPDGRSRISDWLLPGGRSAVGVLSLF